MKSGQHLGVEAAYDAWAASYDGYDNPMIYAARTALAPILSQVAGQVCLEFGCGTGANSGIVLKPLSGKDVPCGT